MAALLPDDLHRFDPREAWQPWAPASGEWSSKWAAHLYRRAGFGATAAELDRALKEGFPATLNRLLAGEPDSGNSQELFAEAGKYCKDISDLRLLWLAFMMNGGHPLREKMTLFWHNHFATSEAKVRKWRTMFDQNVLLREHALGKFRPFLLEISRNPAMLKWLDSNQNVKQAPNENYARELMELFSLGVGNYTERDVREAARAFTGWHTDLAPKRVSFEFHPEEHDDGPKTIFGKTGAWNGEDVVRLCCDHTACARFLVGKLYRFLVSETPPPAAMLTPLEERFRKSDHDIADLVRTMLGSRIFFSIHAYRKRVKWPVEYVLEAVRTLLPAGAQPTQTELVEPLAGMGQVLFAPPSVKGWRIGTDWLNSARLLTRNNFAEYVAVRKLSGPFLMGESSVPSNADPIIVLPTSSPGFTLSRFLGVAQASESTSRQPTDPVHALCRDKPRPAALLARMSALLFDEPLPAARMARIEQFLREPLQPLIPPAASGKIPPTNLPTEPTSPIPTVAAFMAPLPHVPTMKAGEMNYDSPEFNLRIRETLHALMCLPEYQLN